MPEEEIVSNVDKGVLAILVLIVAILGGAESMIRGGHVPAASVHSLQRDDWPPAALYSTSQTPRDGGFALFVRLLELAGQ